MVIHDPNEEKPYSKDHFLQLADWYHDQSEDLLAWFLNSTTNPDGNEPVWNSGLINGIGQFNCSDVPSILDCTTKTPYIQEIEPGSTVRLRLVNMGTFAAFLVGIDGHDMTVIEVDGTRVNPYVVDMLTINVGQRYSVLVTASLKPANYWIRATMYHGDPWTSVSNMPPGFDADVRAILNYQGIPRTSPPVAMEPKFRRQQSSQHQEPLTIMNNVGDMALVPLISKKPPPSDTVILYEFDFDTKPGDLYQKAYNSLYQLNTHNNKSQWTHLFTSSFYQAATPPPLLVSAHANGFLWSPPASANTVFLNPGAVVDFIIRNDDPGEHPFHIHGHFFWVMAAGIANSIAHVPSGRALNQIKNPLRRDVVTVSACPHGEDTECLEASMTDFPGYSQASRSAAAAAAAGDASLPPSPSGRDRWFGYAVVRIVADNPGLWLMHCHINWHTANGLSITLVESIGGITELEKPDGVDESCESFKNWEGDSDGSAP
ncbi:Cupredoxin [Obelidium mucronatum]|nr:Cupredoxin [Obelidium mucronatum]